MSAASLSVGKLEPSAMARYQQLYAAARRPRGCGQHRLDEVRFMRDLEQAGVEPRTRQELYNLALRAEADGRESLFEPTLVAARRKAS